MNTNHQIQSNSNTSTTNGQDRFVELDQGGALSRIYKNYEFEPYTESIWDRNIVKEYADIGKELISILSKDKVVYMGSYWKKKHGAKQSFFGKWTPPEFVEDGGVALLKKDFQNNKWGKQLWADYMWYESGKTKSLFLQLDSEFRTYRRDLCVFQEKINKDIMDAFVNVTYEDLTDFGVRIFPHSKIEHLENDKETVRSYVHREDFIVQIAFDLVSAGIVIEVNHEYMSYEQMLEIIEPLFEKRGIKIKDKTDPYIYANYPPDYVEHNKYPCAGYQFFD